jgi:NAD(P)-dependent dehydrogenase (short-subunit alcohol dehydrogenase family)
MASRWTFADLPELTGKTIVVTGANGGLGFEVTRAIAGKGATVVMACRSETKARAAIERIEADVPGARLRFEALDLADLDSVRAFAERTAETTPTVDVLLNNAGIMAIPRRETAQRFEMQLGTNHLGHFALTGLLLPRLLAVPGSRVVTVSSSMHYGGKVDFDDLDGQRRYNKWKAYNQSKLANLLFAYELQRRLAAAGTTTISVAAHPGYSETNLQGEGPTQHGARIRGALYRGLHVAFAQSAQSGALPLAYAAVGPDVAGGDYFGPGSIMQLWGAPKKVGSSGRSYDEAVAAKLWDVSEERTHVRYALQAVS